METLYSIITIIIVYLVIKKLEKARKKSYLKNSKTYLEQTQTRLYLDIFFMI